MENELKPCPFCGCELEQHGDKLGKWWTHPINDCILSCIDDVDGFVTIMDYEVEKWNRRCNDGT